ncbi:ShlB/FhaC/HecB family hemolysin secretion/activation protein [Luteolibacter yonseiensis]|uniref:ShlB/FhaC/HecB family hemolysin secretion/activation protein n=1 Tax=Luteolibacter yonseiensis TaxID=1144680 RepID=A0A934QZB7_9BACT|nr:ShlB/FhaC/HecB family hemolysin secretion/activation protein [Luteolibacter yonseiensis]MBK1815493.1 ShlB/FhaC/HecB family hemolysin secretion/activation protein [Luteolibacter yonseiensis]
MSRLLPSSSFFTAFCITFVLHLSAHAQVLNIREYRVTGPARLPRLAVEEAVYPYLGPGRSADDVEAARVALEKAYHDRGFQTVSVVVPQQDPRRGVIRLEVAEARVGRLRVNGARFFLPSRIKADAPSLAEGNVPDMKRVEKEIVALNRLADRRVTPELRAGVVPGTVDIDLNVEDKNPLHGSLELNNRYSSNTTPLRLNGSLSHGNLYQLGHTGGFNFQVAPENTDDAKVFSGYYLARVSDSVSLMLQGTKQDSDVAIVGGSASIGRGHTVSLQALIDLPSQDKFYQTLSLGLDYKHFSDEVVSLGKKQFTIDETAIEYWPLSANYGATWLAEKAFTEANTSLNLHLRGIGSGERDYANKRYNADGSYVFLRGDVAHTRDLRDDSQLFGKVQYQLADKPLVNNEQISGGGLGTVRGYLEATSLGDNGVFGTVEYRTRPLTGGSEAKPGTTPNEWRFHGFVDAGLVGIYDPLPGQRKRFGLASAGAGTRFKFADHYNGSVDLAVPFISQTDTESGDVRVTFRGWADF